MLLLIKYTLLYGIVLMLVALGGMFSEHSGIINIALEGIDVYKRQVVTKEPVTEKVTVGTKKVSSGASYITGSGRFIWPVPGYRNCSRWYLSLIHI